MITRLKARIYKPKGAILDHGPTSFKEANNVNWSDVMALEFQTLQSQGTWILVTPPSHYNIMGCKWVKEHADGSISLCKACIVAKGYNMRMS